MGLFCLVSHWWCLMSHQCPISVPAVSPVVISCSLIHSSICTNPLFYLRGSDFHPAVETLRSVMFFWPRSTRSSSSLLPVHVYKRTETRTVYLLLLLSESKLAFIFKGATMNRSTVRWTVDLCAVDRLYWLWTPPRFELRG